MSALAVEGLQLYGDLIEETEVEEGEKEVDEMASLQEFSLVPGGPFLQGP